MDHFYRMVYDRIRKELLKSRQECPMVPGHEDTRCDEHEALILYHHSPGRRSRPY